MFYEVFFIFNYFWGLGFLVFRLSSVLLPGDILSGVLLPDVLLPGDLLSGVLLPDVLLPSDLSSGVLLPGVLLPGYL